MARRTVSLRIEIESDSVDAAAKANDRLASASEKAAAGMSAAETEGGLAAEVFGELVTTFGNLSPASSAAGGAMGKMPLGSLATKANLAAAAVVGVAVALHEGARAAQEMARDMNQRLLDSIEDTARGSESATETFEELENVMRNLRGRSDALALGFSSTEDALASAEDVFRRNEAIILTLEDVIPNVSDAMKRWALDGIAWVYDGTVAANEELIDHEIAMQRAARAVEALDEAYRSGAGVERVDEFHELSNVSDDLRDGYAELISAIINLDDATRDSAVANQHMASTSAILLSQLEDQDIITADVRRGLLQYIGSAEGAAQMALVFSAAQEEAAAQSAALRDRLEEIEEAAERARRAAAAARREDSGPTFDEALAAKELLSAQAQKRALVEQMEAAARLTEVMHGLRQARIDASIAANLDAEQDRAERMEAEAEKASEVLRRIKLDAERAAQENADRQMATGQLVADTMSTTVAGMSSVLGSFVSGDLENVGAAFAGILGDILVNLGTTAVTMGTLALAAAAFPALSAVLPPASAPAVIAAGAAAIVAGTALGAVASGASSSAGASAPSASSAEAATATEAPAVNLSLDLTNAGLPRRAYQRATVERNDESAQSAA